jgi:hypothetical protein
VHESQDGTDRGVTPNRKRSPRAKPKTQSVGVQRVDTPKSHYYTINGQRVVGVTTALNALPKDALVPWAAGSVATHVVENFDDVARRLEEDGPVDTIRYLKNLPNTIRDDAATRGTDVHDYVFDLAEGKPVDVPNEVLPYVRGALAYLDDYQPTTVMAETVVASYEHMYCGTLDTIQDVPRLGRVLVDWKTSKGLYANHALQIPAYRYTDVYLDAEGNERPMIEVEDTFVLHIKPDDYDLVPVKAGREQFAQFLGVLDTYRGVVQSNKGVKLFGTPLPKPSAVAA